MEDFIFDHPVIFCLGVAIVVPLIIFVSMFVNINTGDKQYTGYIYSAEDYIAKTTGNIRFSENAGADEQPSFCVDKQDGQQLKDLAGSGKKVKVTIPARFSIIAPWACAFPAKIEEI